MELDYDYIVDERYLAEKHKKEETSGFMLFSRQGKDLPARRITQLECSLYQSCLGLQPPYENTYATQVKNRGDWIVFLGVAGMLQILLAAGFALAGDVIATVRETASLAVVTGRRRWLLANAVCRTALPLSLAGILGAVSYLVLPSGLLHGYTGVGPSPTLALIAMAGSVLAGLLVAAWGALRTDRATRTWRPGA